MKFPSLQILVLGVFLLFFCKAYGQSEPTYIPAYTYHLKPPFVIDQPTEKGLYYDLVEKLSDEQYHYYLVYVPRKRIDRLLSQDTLDGIVVGVSPHWFKDRETTKYNWTSSFMMDRDDIVSPGSKPYEYSHANLANTTMAGVRGFFYANVDPFAEQFNVRRFNTDSEIKVLEMVVRRRVDFGIVSSSTFNYLVKENDALRSLHVSSIPHEAFNRRILVPKSKSFLHTHLQQRISDVVPSTSWKQALSQYGLKSAFAVDKEMAAN